MVAEEPDPSSSRRTILAASGAALVGLLSIPVGIGAATGWGRHTESSPWGGDGGLVNADDMPVGPLVDLRRFGAVPDGTTDVAMAINRAVAEFDGTSCALTLPVTRPGESYWLGTDAVIDRPGISLVGNGATIHVADSAAVHLGSPDRVMVANSRISGINWIREDTGRGSRIPSSSRFLVLNRIRDLVIEACVFRGADVAIHIPANAASGMHDTAFVHIVGQNRFEEVNFAVKGEFDPSAPGSWTSIGDMFITNCVINRAYVTAVHFDAIDGLEVNECDFVSVGSQSVEDPRVADKRNNIFIGQCDWVHVSNNQLYEAGLEAVRVDGARQIKITGNLIAWPGQLDLSDGIRISGFEGFPARAVVSENMVVYYTKSAVSISGVFASIALGAISASFSGQTERYIGPSLPGSTAPALASISHYRYDLGDVSGIRAAQISIAGSSSQRPGESDKLPGHLYTVMVRKDTALTGASAALRELTIVDTTGVFPLSDIEGSPAEFSGSVTVVVKSGYEAGSKSSQYLLMIAAPGDQCLALGATGHIEGRTADSPTFTWSVRDSQLFASPVGATSGRFIVSAQTTGNVIAG